jgi:hypothetical protein
MYSGRGADSSAEFTLSLAEGPQNDPSFHRLAPVSSLAAQGSVRGTSLLPKNLVEHITVSPIDRTSTFHE